MELYEKWIHLYVGLSNMYLHITDVVLTHVVNHILSFAEYRVFSFMSTLLKIKVIPSAI